jgi:hypothetical protein
LSDVAAACLLLLLLVCCCFVAAAVSLLVCYAVMAVAGPYSHQLTRLDMITGTATKLNPDGSSSSGNTILPYASSPAAQLRRMQQRRQKLGLPPLPADQTPIPALNLLTLLVNGEYLQMLLCGGPVMHDWLKKLLEPSFR